MNRFKGIGKNLSRFAGIGLVLGTLLAPFAAQAASQPRDADMNSIIFNGAYTKSEWLSKVQKGDGKHSAANISQIYFNEGRGITEANFMSSDTVDGTAYKDGTIVVGGKVVATGGESIGRTNIAGSHK